MSECVGSGLIQKGFKASSDQFIGIFAQNRPEVITVRYRLSMVLQVLRRANQGPHLLLLETRFRGLLSTEIQLCVTA